MKSGPSRPTPATASSACGHGTRFAVSWRSKRSPATEKRTRSLQEEDLDAGAGVIDLPAGGKDEQAVGARVGQEIRRAAGGNGADPGLSSRMRDFPGKVAGPIGMLPDRLRERRLEEAPVRRRIARHLAQHR